MRMCCIIDYDIHCLSIQPENNYVSCELDKITFVVLSKARPSIPEVTLSAPDFFKITSVVCFSDPNLKPYNKETKDKFF